MTDADRIAALEAAVDELRTELAALRTRPQVTMRRDLTCGVCNRTQIIHVRQIDRSFSGLEVLGIGSFDKVDPFEIFVCRGCSSVEWYATGFGNLAIDGKKLIAIEREEPSSGNPYR